MTGPLLVAILAILWGADVTAAEEERGTIDVLMANPISRRRVAMEKWAAVMAGGALVTLTVGVSWHLLVLVGLIAVFLTGSVIGFERRDLAVA